MRLVRTITTPWAPYGVAFSHDGTRLAIGGGNWYGNGGLQLEDADGASTRVARSETISNVCWSADDRQLAASTWRATQRGAAALVCATDGELACRALLDPGLHPATGVVFDDGDVLVRHHRADLSQMIVRRAAGVARATPARHLASHRLVVVGELAITGDHGLAEQPRSSQLVIANRRDPKPWLVPISGFRRITAITARQDGTIVIGGADGELAAVTVDTWTQARLRERTRHPPRVSDDNLAWATYTADAITALCTLPDDRVVAASADGELTIVGDDDGVRLEVAGTVRSIAAHPDGHVLAIGYKRGGFAGQSSVVAIVALDPVLDPSLRTPRLIDAARAVDAQRFEPEMLAVFADALEQHGAPPALPAHVRELGARRSCWIVDALLGRASAWT